MTAARNFALMDWLVVPSFQVAYFVTKTPKGVIDTN